MNVVVLGAASLIGAPIAVAFSEGNDVSLVSRDADRLDLVANVCRRAGASSVAVIVQDLRQGTAEACAALEAKPIDVLINIASSTSRLRDNEIVPDDFESHIAVDLLSPIQLVQKIVAGNSGHGLHVIFISSILTEVISPNRSIYSSLKILQEQYLKRLRATNPTVKVTIVKVSKLIPADRDSPDTAKLAQTVVKGFRQGKKQIFFGASGLALAALFFAQPIAFRTLMSFQRTLRGRNP